MNPEQPRTHETDDTQGHCIRGRADAERDETDDTQGHPARVNLADAERDKTEGPDDTEGHRSYWSDARLKRSVTPLTGALQALRQPADRG